MKIKPRHCLLYFCSLKCFNLAFFLFILAVVFTLGGTGVGLFLNESVEAAASDRFSQFEIMDNMLESNLKVPRVLMETLPVHLPFSGMNSSEPSFQTFLIHTFDTIDSFSRSESFDDFMIWFANEDFSELLSFAKGRNTFNVINDRNMHAFMTSPTSERNGLPWSICEIDKSGICISETYNLPTFKTTLDILGATFLAGDVFAMSKWSPIFPLCLLNPISLTPYNFSFCDLVLNYMIPLPNSGLSAVTIFQRNLHTLLKNRDTREESKNHDGWVLDTKGEFIISTSAKKDVIIVEEGNLPRVIDTKVIGDDQVKKGGLEDFVKYSKWIEEKHTKLENLKTGVIHQFSKSGNMIDYSRKMMDGLDIVVCHRMSSVEYFMEAITFTSVFATMSLSSVIFLFTIWCCLMLVISRQFSGISKQLKKAEHLNFDFEDKRYSCVWEIYKIQKRFYALMFLLEQYSRFVPDHIRQHELMEEYRKMLEQDSDETVNQIFESADEDMLDGETEEEDINVLNNNSSNGGFLRAAAAGGGDDDDNNTQIAMDEDDDEDVIEHRNNRRVPPEITVSRSSQELVDIVSLGNARRNGSDDPRVSRRRKRGRGRRRMRRWSNNYVEIPKRTSNRRDVTATTTTTTNGAGIDLASRVEEWNFTTNENKKRMIKNSRSSSGRRRLKKKNEGSKFSRHLYPRTVTLVTMELLSSVSRDDIELDFIDIHCGVMELMEYAMKQTKGCLITFDDCVFVVGFNTFSKIPNHTFHAARFCEEILEKLQKREDLNSVVTLCFSICRGMCHVGVMGSSQQKKPVIFGNLRREGRKLCRFISSEVWLEDYSNETLFSLPRSRSANNPSTPSSIYDIMNSRNRTVVHDESGNNNDDENDDNDDARSTSSGSKSAIQDRPNIVDRVNIVLNLEARLHLEGFMWEYKVSLLDFVFIRECGYTRCKEVYSLDIRDDSVYNKLNYVNSINEKREEEIREMENNLFELGNLLKNGKYDLVLEKTSHINNSTISKTACRRIRKIANFCKKYNIHFKRFIRKKRREGSRETQFLSVFSGIDHPKYNYPGSVTFGSPSTFQKKKRKGSSSGGSRIERISDAGTALSSRSSISGRSGESIEPDF